MTTHQTEVEMGRTYRDEITGFEGVCTAVHFYLTGCNRASLEPVVDKKNPAKLEEVVGFDTMRLIDTETGRKMDQPAPPPALAKAGGPRSVEHRR